MNSHSQTDYTSFSQGSFQKNSVKSNRSPSLDRKDANPHCAIKVVNGITQEIDCHCHSYQFWFVIFLVLYVANFVNTIFVMSKYSSAEISPAPQWLYITYAVMGLIIVIVYVLMEIETWTIHNGTLYLYSILLMTLNYFAIKTLLQNQESDSFKKIFFGCLAIGTVLPKFWIVFKLKFRAKNLIYLEQKRRQVRSDNNLIS